MNVHSKLNEVKLTQQTLQRKVEHERQRNEELVGIVKKIQKENERLREELDRYQTNKGTNLDLFI